MLVCVTGGTGFLGSHSVAELVRAGHRVRLLARDPSGVDAALAPLGVDRAADGVEVVAGDVTDAERVAAALRGTDGVLHAASVYSFDSRQHAAMRRINARGTELVMEAARRADVGLVVHVSTVAALFPAPSRVIGADSPIGRPREAYMASKAAAEFHARRAQDDGAPVAIVYPPALLGPHDPRLGDQSARLRNALRGLMPMWPTGGFPVGDVRDTAALLADLFSTPPAEPGRYFGPNHYLSTRDFVRTLRSVTGRALPATYFPARAMLPAGWFVDRFQRVWPWHIPAEYGAVYTCACATRVAEDAPTRGIAARPAAETMADTVRWLHGAGLLSDRQAGELAHHTDDSAVAPTGARA